MDYKINILSIELNTCDTFHEDWIWLAAEKDGDLSSYTYGDNELSACGSSRIDVLCGGRWGCHWQWVEVGDKHDIDLGMSFIMAHAAYRTVKLFIYVLCIGGCDERNILSMELVLFHLKCVSN